MCVCVFFWATDPQSQQMYDQSAASASLIVDEQMDGIAMSDNRANFLPTIHNSLTNMNNSSSAGYQNNGQINRYSIEHPQGSC